MKTTKTHEVAPGFLKTAGAAAYLSCSPRFVLSLAKRGLLNAVRPSRRVTLFSKADLDRFARGECAKVA